MEGRVVTKSNVTGCPNVTSPQKAEISGNQEVGRCDKNAPGEGVVEMSLNPKRNISFLINALHDESVILRRIEEIYRDEEVSHVPEEYEVYCDLKTIEYVVRRRKDGKEYRNIDYSAEKTWIIGLKRTFKINEKKAYAIYRMVLEKVFSLKRLVLPVIAYDIIKTNGKYWERPVKIEKKKANYVKIRIRNRRTGKYHLIYAWWIMDEYLVIDYTSKTYIFSPYVIIFEYHVNDPLGLLKDHLILYYNDERDWEKKEELAKRFEQIRTIVYKLTCYYEQREEQQELVRDEEMKRLIEESESEKEAEERKEEKKVAEEDELEKKAEELAEKILDSDDPVEAMKQKLYPRLGYGEIENRIILHTLLLGAKQMDEAGNVWKPCIILISGEPGGGKTWLANTSADVLDMTLKRGRLSAHAFDYMDHKSYRILYLQELRLDEASGMGYVRFSGSDDRGYEIEYTYNEGGEFKTKSIRIPAKVIITTSHLVEIDAQFERRAWRLTVDDSPEATQKIKAWIARMKKQEQMKKEGLIKFTEYELAKETWKKLYDKVEAKEVVIPPMFIDLISKYLLTTDMLWERGDFDKIINFLELFTLWYYRKLPKLQTNREEKYIMTPEIFTKAVEVLRKFFKIRVSGVDERILKAIEIAQEIAREKGEETTLDDGKSAYTVNREIIEKVAERLKKSTRTVRRYLKAAYNAGLVDVVKDGNGKVSHYIIINEDDVKTGLGDKFEAEIEAAYNAYIESRRGRIVYPPSPEDNFVPGLWLLESRKFRELGAGDIVTSRDKSKCPRLLGKIAIGLDFADGHKEYFIARLSEDKIREIIDDLRGEYGIIYFLEAEEEALKRVADLGLIPVKIKEDETEVMA